MRTYTKSEAKIEKFRINNKIHSGQIFVYPTDTIYGIGCSALDDDAIQKLRFAKKSGDRPYGIIVPNKEWIHENCEVNDEVKEHMKKLPGPYTLYLKLKNTKAVSKHVNPREGNQTIGVRMPNHWIQSMVAELNIPIVTPPANIVGKNFMTSLDNLDDELKKIAHFAIYEGEKKGKQSKIFYLHK